MSHTPASVPPTTTGSSLTRASARSPLSELAQTLAQSRGRWVSATLTTGENIQGFVHGVCKNSGLVVIEKESGALVLLNVHLITNLSSSTSITIPTERKWPERLPIAQKESECEDYQKVIAKYARIAPVAAAEYPQAQFIFDSLNKTLNTTWCSDGAIEVLDGIVRITPPYTPNHADSKHPHALRHVRLILQNESNRAKLSNATAATDNNNANLS